MFCTENIARDINFRFHETVVCHIKFNINARVMIRASLFTRCNPPNAKLNVSRVALIYNCSTTAKEKRKTKVLPSAVPLVC